MLKPNYKFDKRQRDVAKKKKQEEKRLRKQEKNRPADAQVAPSELAPATVDTAADA